MKEIKDFIAKFLGSYFNDIPATNWKLTHDQSSRFRPVLVIQGDNVDCQQEMNRIKRNNPARTTGDTSDVLYVPSGSGNISKMARTILLGAS